MEVTYSISEQRYDNFLSVSAFCLENGMSRLWFVPSD